MTETAALAHIEKTLADSYRKEIDQEENIWRSLPFFAATLALQLATLFRVIERLPSGRSWPAQFSIEDERHPDNQTAPVPTVALHVPKTSLAMQYAIATDNKRQINKGRERRQSLAGLLTICSVVSTLFLVAVTFAAYLYVHNQMGTSNGGSTQSTDPPVAAIQPKPSGPSSTSPAAPDAGGH